ncbi:MAG: hypothetical protein AAF959_26570 [Cyanobacteria bacterium P01_D01_bin.56]
MFVFTYHPGEPMQPMLALAPRYTLDDASTWLIGIDPVRRYCIRLGCESSITLKIPGLMTASFESLRNSIQTFRSLLPGASMSLPSFTLENLTIHHLAEDLYAIPYAVNGAPAWHLFDRETLESLLLTAHPDWQCTPQDIALGRDLLYQSWAHVA